MKKLQIGDQCYYKGYLAEIATQHGRDNWGIIIHDILDPSIENQPTQLVLSRGYEINVHIVKKVDCHQLVTNVFKMYDNVQSTIGTLKGTIVAFEICTNRAVCVSDSIDNYNDKRTRYAYLPHELKAYDKDAIEFVVGAKYRIGKDVYKAISCSGHYTESHNGEERYVVLVHTTNNTIDYPVIPIETQYSVLKEVYGINSIERCK